MKTPLFTSLLLLFGSLPIFGQHLTERTGSEADKPIRSFQNAPNPMEKAGWNLIFQDEFDGTALDTAKWNVTSVGDDFPTMAYCFANPANVSVSDGLCHLYVTSTEYAGKPYSAAEIKTFTEIGNDAPNYYFDDFHYGFETNTYTEIRVKVPSGKGIGSAGWFWHSWRAWRELDIWETYGVWSPARFKTTYIYTTNETDLSRSSKEFPTADGRHIDQDFYVFGVYRDSSGFDLYINGKQMHRINFGDAPACGLDFWVQDRCALPCEPVLDDWCLRLGVGASLNLPNIPFRDCNSVFNALKNFMECEQTPFRKEMQVDYVRVYQQVGTAAVRIKEPPKIRLDTAAAAFDACIIRHSWYPDVVYTWTFPDALLKASWNRNRTAFTLNRERTLEANQSYRITLTARFPSGYMEEYFFVLET